MARGERRQEVQDYAFYVGSDHRVIGKTGRVIGTIEPGRLGEVMIPIRGGSEAYFAYADDAAETIPSGTRVIVIEHEPPRTVVVSRYS